VQSARARVINAISTRPAVVSRGCTTGLSDQGNSAVEDFASAMSKAQETRLGELK